MHRKKTDVAKAIVGVLKSNVQKRLHLMLYTRIYMLEYMSYIYIYIGVCIVLYVYEYLRTLSFAGVNSWTAVNQNV